MPVMPVIIMQPMCTLERNNSLSDNTSGVIVTEYLTYRFSDIG